MITITINLVLKVLNGLNAEALPNFLSMPIPVLISVSISIVARTVKLTS